MKKPNFFIIGAPKCGTSSLAFWLSKHPQIYMSAVKEPHHFNTDHKHTFITSRDDYEKLFENANNQHVAVGEASVWYLYSQIAVPNIGRYVSGAKYIVCLRNPIEMSYSLHEQLIVAGYENKVAFSTAWNLQLDRVSGKSIPTHCREPSYLAYGAVCSLGDQLERLYSHVPKDKVLPLLLDDVKKNPRAAYLRVLRFLGVEDDGSTNFPVVNPAKELRAPWIGKSIRLLGDLKRSLGWQYSFGLLNSIGQANIRYRKRAPMSISMLRILDVFFRKDIKKLGLLINRDLSHWH